MQQIGQVGLIVLILFPSAVKAQLVPDDTLGTERSQVNSELITGGARRGQNLFHSFEQFNIDENRSAYFVVPDAIVQNVLTRVTGTSASNILGTLGTRQLINGNLVPSSANLFLINPNGILFGENSRLNMGGSFVATTAQGVQFGTLGSFDAINPTSPSPLLTIQPSAFLFNQLKIGAIVNQSIAFAGDDPIGQPAFGLRAGDGKTLTLLGGDVQLQGGQLDAFGGLINVAAIAGAGNVSLNLDGSLGIPDSISRGKVSLTDRAVINAAANQGGNVLINAGEIAIANSTIQSGSLTGLGTPETQSGRITLNATGAIAIDSSQIINSVLGQGRAGDIQIFGRSLTLTRGSRLATNVGSKATNAIAGNVLVNVADHISIEGGVSRTALSTGLTTEIFSGVDVGGVGQGGEVSLSANSISITKGAALISASLGNGNAGRINLVASDSITLDGLSADGFASGVFSAISGQNNRGRGGDIDISTSRFSVLNGAIVDASAGNFQPGGNIFVRADRFEGINGGQIVSTAIGAGRAGNITLEITDQLRLSGRIAARRDPLERDAINNESRASGLFANTLPNTSGNSGSISVSAGAIALNDGAQIAVDSQGKGIGGSIRIAANQLSLDHQSLISAETVSSQGGNISLDLTERLLLRRNSLISTTAGISQAEGDGGNLQLRTPLIVAVPSENSDISANAFTGRGGRIEITAQGIFGIQSQPRPTLRSDITATSEFGISGTITLNQLQVSPSQGLVQLPIVINDASNQIVQYCSPQSQARNSFTNIGRGGIPTNPSQPLSPAGTIVPWVRVDPHAPTAQVSVPKASEPILEAQEIGRDRSGNLALVANSAAIASAPSAICTAR